MPDLSESSKAHGALAVHSTKTGDIHSEHDDCLVWSICNYYFFLSKIESPDANNRPLTSQSQKSHICAAIKPPIIFLQINASILRVHMFDTNLCLCHISPLPSLFLPFYRWESMRIKTQPGGQSRWQTTAFDLYIWLFVKQMSLLAPWAHDTWVIETDIRISYPNSNTNCWSKC